MGNAEISARDASRTSTSASASPVGSVSIRPGPHSSNAARSASPASARSSASVPSTCRWERREARSTSGTDSSSVAACVTRADSSWASSITTTSYSGIIGTPSIASIASSEWLVTISCDWAAFSLARSAKHSSENGHFCAPRHSRWLTETCRHTLSVCLGAESRSPGPLDWVCSSAHSRSASTSLPIDPAGSSTRAPWSLGTPSRIRCRQA